MTRLDTTSLILDAFAGGIDACWKIWPHSRFPTQRFFIAIASKRRPIVSIAASSDVELKLQKLRAKVGKVRYSEDNRRAIQSRLSAQNSAMLVNLSYVEVEQKRLYVCRNGIWRLRSGVVMMNSKDTRFSRDTGICSVGSATQVLLPMLALELQSCFSTTIIFHHSPYISALVILRANRQSLRGFKHDNPPRFALRPAHIPESSVLLKSHCFCRLLCASARSPGSPKAMRVSVHLSESHPSGASLFPLTDYLG